ncbi:hypothetical protein BFW87_00910 [Pseudomonas fluorescens]|uniref:Acyltransferase 3 domain-containing protein n=1 Tax=Pseudomonas fluorescens TaxID=294 RepID=A0A1T2Z8U4_PSEFL|nr:acyltransferase [Pseudomonas fluorescens]OPB00995.1 hypothetical protein BFW87_00910 [Pseudomonas fluorescens]
MSRMTLDQSQQLDSIRALAAFAVLFGHTYQTLLLPTLNSWFTLIVLLSQFAVMAFFVLSGFLIGKSVCNNVSRNSVFNVGEYAVDRALRLYPPLIVALVLMVLLALIAPHFFPSGTGSLLIIDNVDFVRTEFVTSWRDVWGALTFLNGLIVENPLANSPLWSLSLEAWYYVMAAGFFLWPGRKFLSVFLLVVTVYVTHKSSLFYLLAPVWFSGFGLAMIHQHNPRMNNKIFGWAFAVLSIAVAASIVYSMFNQPSGNEVIYERINIFRLASGLWFACFLALIFGGEVRFTKRLHTHASYSYTLYVIHFPVMLFVLGVSQEYIYSSLSRSLAVSAVTIMVSIVISWLLSRWVENKVVMQAGLQSVIRLAKRGEAA